MGDGKNRPRFTIHRSRFTSTFHRGPVVRRVAALRGVSFRRPRRRLGPAKDGFDVGKLSGGGIGHTLLEGVGNPGVIVLNDELGDLRALVWRKSFNVLDNFLDAHIERIPHSAGRHKTDSYRRPRSRCLVVPNALRPP